MFFLAKLDNSVASRCLQLRLLLLGGLKLFAQPIHLGCQLLILIERGSIWSKHRLRYFVVFTISCKVTTESFKQRHHNTGLRMYKTTAYLYFGYKPLHY
jgi:hypothetical protein